MSLSFNKHDVYHKIPFVGQKLIETRWVDTQRNDGVRSRLVAREFRRHHGWERDLAEGVPTPPWDVFKVTMTIGANDRSPLLTIDARRAYFYAKRQGAPKYIRIPAEDRQAGDEDRGPACMAPQMQHWGGTHMFPGS